MKTNILLSLLVSYSFAQPTYIKRTYAKFDKALEPWSEYASWSPHQVSTDDSYSITVFQLIDA